VGRFIVKLHDYYFEYSTVVDAPVTFGMSLDEFKEYYQYRYGTVGMSDLPDRLERVEAKGTSCYNDDDAADTLSCNRAGPNESELTVEQIYQAYCLRQPILDGWLHGAQGWLRIS